MRRISGTPGRNTSTSPSPSARARRAPPGRRRPRSARRAPAACAGRRRGAPCPRPRSDGCVPEQLGQPVGRDRGRGGEQPQVRAQPGAGVEQQREQQVGVEVPLVALVEHHGARAGQLRVGEQPAQQQPGRHHLDPGAGRRPGVAAHRVADALADVLAEQRRHPGGRGAGGEPARLGDQHLARHRAASASGTSVVLPVPGGRDENGRPGRRPARPRRNRARRGPAGRVARPSGAPAKSARAAVRPLRARPAAGPATTGGPPPSSPAPRRRTGPRATR